MCNLFSLLVEVYLSVFVFEIKTKYYKEYENERRRRRERKKQNITSNLLIRKGIEREPSFIV
jgi:hypothetical protein